MVNEIALGLLYGLLGWKVAAIYMGTGLFIAISAGWVIGRLKLENYIEEWVTQTNMADVEVEEEKLTWNDRIVYGWDAVKEIIGRVWIYVILGIAIGAGIHGFVPEGVMASIMGKGSWWSVPVSVLIGVPMYSNAAGIIPFDRAVCADFDAGLTSAASFRSNIGYLAFCFDVLFR